jgi:hypothetical protein
MMRRQRGVTMIGWIFLLTPMALVLYAGLRVGPSYFDYFKVVTALKETGSKLKSDAVLTAPVIRAALEKRFETGYIDSPTIDQIEIKRGDKGWEMSANYEKTESIFGNLHVLMVFNKTVVIGADGAAAD